MSWKDMETPKQIENHRGWYYGAFQNKGKRAINLVQGYVTKGTPRPIGVHKNRHGEWTMTDIWTGLACAGNFRTKKEALMDVGKVMRKIRGVQDQVWTYMLDMWLPVWLSPDALRVLFSDSPVPKLVFGEYLSTGSLKRAPEWLEQQKAKREELNISTVPIEIRQSSMLPTEDAATTGWTFNEVTTFRIFLESNVQNFAI